MRRRLWLGAALLTVLVTTGCSGVGSTTSGSAPTEPAATHVMPDGTVMDGVEHEGHGTSADSAVGPSEAARMVCAGEVPDAVAGMFELTGSIPLTSSWAAPLFTCTYDIEGTPLVLTVYDATDETDGARHFDELRAQYPQAQDIEGMASLGLPSFATGDGRVAFMRDGKTLFVDATALPTGVGADKTQTPAEAAYAVASAVLVCWTHHS